MTRAERVSDAPVEWWACSYCGPHPSSRGGWCDFGCGSDYNRMSLVVLGPWAVLAVLAKVKEQHDLHGPAWQPWPPVGYRNLVGGNL